MTQFAFQKIVQFYGINVVCCNMCDTVFFHKVGETVLECQGCKSTGDISNFTDLY